MILNKAEQGIHKRNVFRNSCAGTGKDLVP